MATSQQKLLWGIRIPLFQKGARDLCFMNGQKFVEMFFHTQGLTSKLLKWHIFIWGYRTFYVISGCFCSICSLLWYLAITRLEERWKNSIYRQEGGWGETEILFTNDQFAPCLECLRSDDQIPKGSFQSLFHFRLSISHNCLQGTDCLVIKPETLPRQLLQNKWCQILTRQDQQRQMCNRQTAAS